MEILFYSHPSYRKGMAMKFCTWHDSCAVMTCTQFFSDKIPHFRVTLKWIFVRIVITMEKSFMKWAPDWLLYSAERRFPDSELRWPHVGPTWILLAPRWANVGPTCLAIWVDLSQEREVDLSHRGPVLLIFFIFYISHCQPQCRLYANITSMCTYIAFVWLFCLRNKRK